MPKKIGVKKSNSAIFKGHLSINNWAIDFANKKVTFGSKRGKHIIVKLA